MVDEVFPDLGCRCSGVACTCFPEDVERPFRVHPVVLTVEDEKFGVWGDCLCCNDEDSAIGYLKSAVGF